MSEKGVFFIWVGLERRKAQLKQQATATLGKKYLLNFKTKSITNVARSSNVNHVIISLFFWEWVSNAFLL